MTGRILLKGAFGFVGSAFWRALASAGTPPEVLTRDNADSLDPNGVELLIECAGNSKKYLADRDPDFDRRANVDELATTLGRFRPKHLVLISSSAVYADTGSRESTREVDEPSGPVSIYGMHKREAERVARQLVARPLILRPAGFFGPGLAKGPLYDLLENKRPWVSSNSQLQLLDVDLLAAVALGLATSGGTYNAVPDCPTTLNNVLPQETVLQGNWCPEPENLPLLQFDLDGRRFCDEVRRLSLAGRSLLDFVASYNRQEARAAVPVLILAGGRGSRLGGPLPKPAMHLLGRSLVSHVVRPFVAAGYSQIAVLMGHGAAEVARALDAEPVFASARRFIEPDPLGTGGSVLKALADLNCESAIVANGDTLFAGLDPEALVKRHMRTDADATLLAVPTTNAGACGTLDVAADGHLLAFHEEKEERAGRAALAYAGVAVVRRGLLLGQFPTTGACSLERDVFATLARTGRVQVLVEPRLRFVDAGTPEGWSEAEHLLEKEMPCSS